MKKISTLFVLIWLEALIVAGHVAVFANTQSKVESTEIPTVDFCEMIRHPRRYFDKSVRIEAKWESGFEFAYLTTDRCGRQSIPEIAVQFNGKQPEYEEIRKAVDKIQSREYGGRAMIRVIGILRNPGKYYGYFRYLFEIRRFEDVAHFIVPYQGTLAPGTTYRALVRGDKALGLSLVPPLIVPNAHFATRIEWLNLSEFPALQKLHETPQEKQIVFSVMADNIQQMSAQSWNREFECKIIRLE